ncbi:hypothetical protein DPEC_G00259210 [Dallia pectoralis]|uniref:Uncharacterized protein n=1 Tax=Dallia pectoralis TaxID=75939 RepID=A0ACC2FRC9_DALPE|nr:hypothetical protein DPEC_G00259210 [Dallia pectoralis]
MTHPPFHSPSPAHSSTLAKAFVWAADDTPDAPAQTPLSATFTSLPSGHRSPPGTFLMHHRDNGVMA